jgi:hypothetical protein
MCSQFKKLKKKKKKKKNVDQISKYLQYNIMDWPIYLQSRTPLCLMLNKLSSETLSEEIEIYLL